MKHIHLPIYNNTSITLFESFVKHYVVLKLDFNPVSYSYTNHISWHIFLPGSGLEYGLVWLEKKEYPMFETTIIILRFQRIHLISLDTFLHVFISFNFELLGHSLQLQFEGALSVGIQSASIMPAQYSQ